MRQTTSPARPSGSRLVASTETSRPQVSSRRDQPARGRELGVAGVEHEQQAPAGGVVGDGRMTGRPGSGRSPSVAATLTSTRSGSVTARGRRTTPRRESPRRSSPATSTASRVLPAPPAPTTVTRRWWRARSTQRGPLGAAADEPGDLHRAGCARGRRPSAAEGTAGPGRARRAGRAARGRRSRAAGAGRGRAARRRPRARRLRAAVAAEQSTWPPCAAAATRAARCTSGLAYSPASGSA